MTKKLSENEQKCFWELFDEINKTLEDDIAICNNDFGEKALEIQLQDQAFNEIDDAENKMRRVISKHIILKEMLEISGKHLDANARKGKIRSITKNAEKATIDNIPVNKLGEIEEAFFNGDMFEITNFELFGEFIVLSQTKKFKDILFLILYFLREKLIASNRTAYDSITKFLPEAYTPFPEREVNNTENENATSSNPLLNDSGANIGTTLPGLEELQQQNAFNQQITSSLISLISNMSNNMTKLSDGMTSLLQNNNANTSNNDFKSILDNMDKNNEKLVKSLGEQMNKQNIDNHLKSYYFQEKYDGSEIGYLRFLRHLINTVFDNKLSIIQTIDILKNSMVDEYVDVLDNLIATHGQHKGVNQFYTQQLDKFGHRSKISYNLVKYFLKEDTLFNPFDMQEATSFHNKLFNLVQSLAFIGCSNCVDNYFFYEELLENLDRQCDTLIRKWITHASNKNILIPGVFQFSQSTDATKVSLKYITSTPSADDEDKLIIKYVNCPVENGNLHHQMNFKIAYFLDWFKEFWLPQINRQRNTDFALEHRNSRKKEYGHTCLHDSQQRKSFSKGGYNSRVSRNNFTRKTKNKFTKFGFRSSGVEHSIFSNPPHIWMNNTRKSAFIMNEFKDLHPIQLLIFLKKFGGCSICGCKHKTGTCPNKNATWLTGYPCKKEHSRTESAHFHNDRCHVNNWNTVRFKGLRLIDRKKKAARCLTVECNDVSEKPDNNQSYIQLMSDEEGEGLFDYMSGGFLNRDMVDIDPNGYFSDDILSDDEEINVCTVSCFKNDDCNNFQYIPPMISSFRIFVQIIIQNVDGSSSLKAIALIDTGSDKTMITSQLQKQGFIKGRKSVLRMTGINTTRQQDIELCEFNVINPLTRKGYRIKNIPSLDTRGHPMVPTNTVPSKSIVECVPDLKDIADEWPVLPMCHVIFGCDYLSLLQGPRVENWDSECPIENAPIGKTFGGQLCKHINKSTKRVKHNVKLINAYEMECALMMSDEQVENLGEIEISPAIEIDEGYDSDREYKVNRNVHKVLDYCQNEREKIERLNSIGQGYDTDVTNIHCSLASIERNVQQLELDTVSLCLAKDDRIESVDTDYCEDIHKVVNYSGSGDNKEELVGKLDGNIINKDNMVGCCEQCQLKDCSGTDNIDRMLMHGNTLYSEQEISMIDDGNMDGIGRSPITTNSEPLLQKAKTFQLPDYQRMVMDQVSEDMKECISEGKVHEDYEDLLTHSYNDPKKWTIEHEYTFREMAKGSYKCSVENRYVIPMIMNSRIKNLSNSDHMARAFARSHADKAKKNPVMANKFKEYFDEMDNMSVLEDIPKEELDNEECYYVPWFPIESGTGEDGKKKLRYVFNASMRINKLSLNDCLFSGPEITASILHAAHAFREKPIAVITDIKKMFWQFLVPPKQRDYLRVLVHENNDVNKPLVHKRFRRITFGVKQATMQTAYGLYLMALENSSNAGEVALKTVLGRIMVDDANLTTHTVSEAFRGIMDLIDLGRTCGLNFVKVDSNSQSLINKIPGDCLASNAGPNPVPVEIDGQALNQADLISDLSCSKLLGTLWHKDTDTLSLRVEVKPIKKLTKRTCLSQLNSIYDTFGIGAAVTLTPKLLIQQMHKQNLGWDVELDEHLKKQWMAWLEELPYLGKIHIRRCYIMNAHVKHTDLHIYSDASQIALAFIAFFRTVYLDENLDIIFITSNSCVVPIKCISSVQRLELDSILRACERIHKIIFNLEININNTYFWSDSMFSLRLINSIDTKLSIFEMHRVKKINFMSSNFIWCHIPGIFNPADIYTKGANAKVFYLEYARILEGPENLKRKDPLLLAKTPKQFLKESEANTLMAYTHMRPIGAAKFNDLIAIMRNMKEPPVTCGSALVLNEENRVPMKVNVLEINIDSLHYKNILSLLNSDQKEQSWNSLILEIARYIRVKFEKRIGDNFSKAELENARNVVIYIAQLHSWSYLIPKIIQGKRFSCPNDLKVDYKIMQRLSVFFDNEKQVLCCYGRQAAIDCSWIAENSVKKLLLPDKNPFTKKLILSIHEQLGHLGPVATEARLNDTFWLIRPKSYIDSVLSSCLACKYQKALTHSPPMATLPKARSQAWVSPFHSSGVDLCGPIVLKGYGKRNVNKKCWVMILSCMSTRATKFSLLTDMTSETLLLELEKINLNINLVINHIYCDCGTNLIGASNILKKDGELLHHALDVSVSDLLDNEAARTFIRDKLNIQFHFNHPRTSHACGHIEAMVKIFKQMLYRCLSPFDKNLNLNDITIKEFELILAKLQYAINQRPLTRISNSNKDIDFITPASFLTTPIAGVKEYSGLTVVNYAEFFEESRKLKNEFYKNLWTIWLSLYLHDLLIRQKWYTPIKKFSKGDMVLYKIPSVFYQNYPIATIVDLEKSTDGILRHVKIKEYGKTKTKIVPIHHLVSLEGSND